MHISSAELYNFDKVWYFHLHWNFPGHCKFSFCQFGINSASYEVQRRWY